MLTTRSLTFAYPGGNPFHFPDFTCETGEHMLIIGESGQGKTTLLHLLAGLLNPQRGDITLDGTSIPMLGPRERDRFRGQKIGLIFQRAHFVSSLCVEENLLLAQYLAGFDQNFPKVKDFLTRLNLFSKRDAKPNRLSLGEQQRVAIARALLNEPTLILADEPTSSLDDTSCDRVLELLENEADRIGASLIIVTHDQRLKDRFPHRLELEGGMGRDVYETEG